MQPNKHIDDLDYIANIGFQESDLTDKEIHVTVSQLNKTIEQKLALNSSVLFTIVNILIGVFLGITLFFTLLNKTKVTPTVSALSNNSILFDKLPDAKKIKLLDTVIIEENFLNNSTSKNSVTVNTLQSNDSIQFEALTPNQINQISTGEIANSKLKFIPNSPVHYLHDLKITNYTQLYFKNLEKIEVNEALALELQYPLNYKYKTSNQLKDYSALYLNNVISDAMLDFKNKNYKECKFKLNLLKKFNTNDDNVLFYEAMCLYYQGFYNESILLFTAALESKNNTFHQEANYYLALSLSNINENEKAKTILQQIEKEEGFYASKAKQNLQEWLNRN